MAEAQGGTVGTGSATPLSPAAAGSSAVEAGSVWPTALALEAARLHGESERARSGDCAGVGSAGGAQDAASAWIPPAAASRGTRDAWRPDALAGGPSQCRSAAPHGDEPGLPSGEERDSARCDDNAASGNRREVPSWRGAAGSSGPCNTSGCGCCCSRGRNQACCSCGKECGCNCGCRSCSRCASASCRGSRGLCHLGGGRSGGSSDRCAGRSSGGRSRGCSGAMGCGCCGCCAGGGSEGVPPRSSRTSGCLSRSCACRLTGFCRTCTVACCRAHACSDGRGPLAAGLGATGPCPADSTWAQQTRASSTPAAPARAAASCPEGGPRALGAALPPPSLASGETAQAPSSAS
mmetsp:Transcript_25988/g.74187  ORF Transcript_25988/g.74187 Transcript_25988/m.74187 type:complete len:350 (-) Transcript_25988:144-1193(-)